MPQTKGNVRYPDITVKLSGEDNGNAFAVIERVVRALEAGDVSRGEIERFRAEATSGDHDTVIQTARHWVNVEE